MSKTKVTNKQVEDLLSAGSRLSLELQCLLLECRDMSAVSKWFDPALEAVDAWNAAHSTVRKVKVMQDRTRQEVLQWCKDNKCDFLTPVYPPPEGWFWATSGGKLTLSPIFTITDQGNDITLEEVRELRD